MSIILPPGVAILLLSLSCCMATAMGNSCWRNHHHLAALDSRLIVAFLCFCNATRSRWLLLWRLLNNVFSLLFPLCFVTICYAATANAWCNSTATDSFDCRQNTPPTTTTSLLSLLSIQQLTLLHRNRQMGDCSQIESSLLEVMCHLLCGKSVAESATVIAKALCSYEGNWSVTHLFHDLAYCSFKHCIAAKNKAASNKINGVNRPTSWSNPVQSADPNRLCGASSSSLSSWFTHSCHLHQVKNVHRCSQSFCHHDEGVDFISFCLQWQVSVDVNYILIVNTVVVVVVVVIRSINWPKICVFTFWYYMYGKIHRAAEFFSPTPVPDRRGKIRSGGVWWWKGANSE